MIENPTSDLENASPTIRTGVIVCRCGGAISNQLDVDGLCQQARQIQDVVFAMNDAYPCSKDGQLRIQQAIQDQNINRVLVAGCTPRLVEKHFQQTVQSAGLDPTSLGIADIREQCSNVHKGESDRAFDKAANLIEIEAARLANIAPFTKASGRVLKSALILGSSLSGLVLAVDLAKAGISVILVEPADNLKQDPPWFDERSSQLAEEYRATIENHPGILKLLAAQIQDLSGSPGDYKAVIVQNGKTIQIDTGAILITGESHPQELSVRKWINRQRVLTQTEFQAALNKADVPQNIVMILCYNRPDDGHCSRLCCMTGIHQALRAKQLNPQSQITVLFHDLYLIGSDGEGETLVKQAVTQGITFFRYSKEHPPIISEETIDLPDPLTNDTLRIPYQRAVLAMPLVPQEHANQLARLMHMPLDKNGYLIRPRIRLRPGRFADDGIFIVGGSHQPSTLEETLLQAYLTSGRTQHFLHQETIRSGAPAAQIDKQLCTGCGECVQACLTYAIHLEKQAGVLSRSQVDPLRCTGCGSCAVACPVKAITIPGWEDTTILAQISAALQPRRPAPYTPGIIQPDQNVLVLACEWSAYAAADIAGVNKKTYPANVRIIRMNCSARFDPYHVLWAFLNGAQGVFLGACQTGECHYGAGNLQARERIHGLQHQLAEHGIDPERLHLEFLAADDGEGFVKALHSFIAGLGNQHRRTVWSKD